MVPHPLEPELLTLRQAHVPALVPYTGALNILWQVRSRAVRSGRNRSGMNKTAWPGMERTGIRRNCAVLKEYNDLSWLNAGFLPTISTQPIIIHPAYHMTCLKRHGDTIYLGGMRHQYHIHGDMHISSSPTAVSHIQDDDTYSN